MTKKELIEALQDIPDNARVFVKQTFDDAYAPRVRKFSFSKKDSAAVDAVVLYPDSSDHVSVYYLTEVE